MLADIVGCKMYTLLRMRRIGARNERNIRCINNFICCVRNIFAIAIFVFGITICCVQSVSKTKEDRLILLDEVMLVHTDENIDCQSKQQI